MSSLRRRVRFAEDCRYRLDLALSGIGRRRRMSDFQWGYYGATLAYDLVEGLVTGRRPERIGRVQLAALEAPIRKLASNAGQDGSVIIDTVRRTAVEKKNKNIGYNVLTGQYTDMIQAGVIDPVKVVRGALENASSIASMILTTDVLITDMPEKEKAPAMPPGGMGGMDY